MKDDFEVNDFELNDWRTEWKAQTELSECRVDLRAGAVKQQRWLRTAHVAELFAAVIFLLFSAAFAWRNPGLEMWLWAGTVWASTLVATVFSLWNWNILWKANVKSVAEFALDYRKRCLASLRAVRFGMGFLVAQNAITVPWLTWDYLRHRITDMGFAAAMALVAALSLGFWLFFSRFRRMALRDLEELDASHVLSTE
jgi:cation transport ATPase